MHNPYKLRSLAASLAAISAAGLMTACGGGGSSDAAGPGVYDAKLAFDKAKYTTITVTLDGVATPVRWYREVCYVGKPMTLAPTTRRRTPGAGLSVAGVTVWLPLPERPLRCSGGR